MINTVVNNKLLVVKSGPKLPSGHTTYWCECLCGNRCILKRATDLKNLRKVNGCRHCSAKKHEYYGHYIYDTFCRIKTRCYNSDSRDYKNYGARGIYLAEEWVNDPKAFVEYVLKELGERPENHSLDRINNDKGYVPGNLRWATYKIQNNNRRNSIN